MVQLLIVIIGGLIGALQAVIIMLFSQLKARMVEFCMQNIEEHRDIRHQVAHHKHAPGGEVIIQ